MPADAEQKAMQLLADADKKLKSAQGFFGSMFNAESKIIDACELYSKAANSFKLSKKWSAGGSAYSKSAELHFKVGNKHEAATLYTEASHCYKRTEPHKAIECLRKGNEIYTDMGRFTMAAKNHQAIAEIYEETIQDFEKSIYHYEQAADFYKGEEAHSTANKCLLQVAKHSAMLEKYEKSIFIYEEVGRAAVDNALLKSSAKDYFFKAAICHLCIDSLNATQAITKYCEMYPAFQDSREYKLVKTLANKLEDQDLEGFQNAVADYESVTRFDKWNTEILSRIRAQLQESGDLC
ncbi:alpha-soluble NSF attachment protein-like [Galendromus occidentalis]|uniref:Alpha-soluble NSF attachment protein-like n=1 Tax=Galendromus occidentalis TaxID=34638 RepID=A0AAJ6QQ17_9ACAR|nr:alpha-soluble NSF attachment protein-like [Galendromus occidentalis]